MIWKDGILWKSYVFSDENNVQPTTWGKAYYSEKYPENIWSVEKEDDLKNVTNQFLWSGEAWYTLNNITDN